MPRGRRSEWPTSCRYRLQDGVLDLQVVGGPSVLVEPGDADFVDLGFSPLTNTLPILRDGLHRAGGARDYVMALVDVPSLDVSRSEQRYEPIGPNTVRFRSGSFEAVLELDDDGFVRRYPGLAEQRTRSLREVGRAGSDPHASRARISSRPPAPADASPLPAAGGHSRCSVDRGRSSLLAA